MEDGRWRIEEGAWEGSFKLGIAAWVIRCEWQMKLHALHSPGAGIYFENYF